MTAFIDSPEAQEADTIATMIMSDLDDRFNKDSVSLLTIIFLIAKLWHSAEIQMLVSGLIDGPQDAQRIFDMRMLEEWKRFNALIGR